MKTTLSCLAAFLLMALPLWGQSVVVNNPSTCRIGLDLTDASCDPTVNVVPDPDVVLINVNSAPGTVLGQDVVLSEVQLIIRHTWANDLDISLRSPAGITVPLSRDNGGGNDNFGDPSIPDCGGIARLSMGSCVSIEEGVPPFTSQVWRPEGSFYDFNDGVTDPNGFWELIICDDAEGDIGRLDYVHLIFAPLECVPVEEVNVLSVDTTSVAFGWMPATSCGTTIVEYGPTGFSPGSGGLAGGGTVDTLTGCPPFTLSGLPAEATFDLYVRKSCSASYSVNSCPLTFTTGCAPPPVSLLADFDSEADCDNFCDSECSLTGIWQNATYNSYNWLVNAGPTATVGTGPSTDFSGSGNYLYLEASGQFCGDDKVAYLLSDCIRLDKAGTDTCHFSFAYHMSGDGIGSLRVQASGDGGFTWSTLWQRSGSQGAGWRQAYVGLGDYADGSVLRLRMVGEEGNGSRGDIAIDALAFHGSVLEGPPAFVYYTDADDDGYGDTNQPIASCASSAPDGFASLDGDCDDGNPSVNPSATEIPCNGVDENCSGNADDGELPPPVAVNDTICVGGTAVLRAENNFDKLILWYDQPTGGSPIAFGDTYIPTSPLDNTGPAPEVYTFYAEESDFVCVSATRAAVSVVVNPTPNTSVPSVPSICPGDSIDLNGLSVQDANFTAGSVSFHNNFPTNPGNELPSTLVQPEPGQLYYYRMTAPFGCFDEGVFSIGIKSGPNLAFQPADSVSICKDENGTLDVVPSGGETPYSYLWSTGDMQSSINISSATQAGVTDVYRLTVTDASGCFSVDSVRVSTTVSVDSVRRFVSNVSTCEGTDGRITLVPLDGQSPYGYLWEGTNGVTGSSSGVSDTLVINNLPQGAYRVTITDSSPEGCTRVVRSILVNGPGAAVQQIDRNPVTCPGAMDGSICLSVFGTAPVYLWNTGDTTACIDNLSGGYYAVTVTDGECETVLDSLLIAEAENLQIAYTSQMPSCVDASDGAIQAQVFGGQAPYDYQWSQGANFSDPFDLTAGDYTLTVTDGRNCVLIDTFELLAPAALGVDLIIGEDVSCPDATDGQLLATGTGGTPPYRYEWSHGPSGPFVVNLSPADYTVTVTDFNGCSAVETYAVVAPDPLQLNVEEVVNPACIGEKTGLIRLSGEGGTRPYTYQWNLLGSDSLQNDLSVGTYTAVLLDANGCTSDTVSVTMDAMSVLDLTIDVVAPPCVGPATGSISLQPQGTPPFTYDWENGASGPELDNLEAGTYPLIITDGQGCIYDTTVVIAAPQLFSVNINTLSPACADSEDGLINLTVVNAPGAPPFTPPLSYTWNDGASGVSRIGIGGGDYQVTVMDANGCAFESDTIPLLEPLPIQLGLEGLGSIACRGDSTGFIEIDVRGGTPPYTYNWVGQSATTQDLFDISAGNYRLLVSDSNDCSYDTTFVLNDPPALSVGIGIEADDICSGGRVEQLVAEAQGGMPPYELAWSNGSTDSMIVSPPTADYTLSVTDANNCLQTAGPLKVKEETEPLALDSLYADQPACFGQNNGCVTAVISGGSGNYQYHFSSGQITYTDTTALTVCSLSPGNYRVTVTDFTTGCFLVSNDVSVTEPMPLTFQRDSVQPVRCFGGLTGAIFASTSGGTSPYTYIWRNMSDGSVVGNEEDLEGVPAGTYRCLVFDDRGCSATLIGTVPNLNTLMRDTLVDVEHIACRGDSNGVVDLEVIGGMPPYQYEWNGGLGDIVPLDNLPAGSYSLTVTDDFGCTQIFPSYEVEEPDSLLELASVSIDSLLCYGDTDGKIKVEIAGGVSPYALEWERNGVFLPTSADSLINVFAGNYTLRVLDDNGCLKTYDIEMPQPDSVTVEVDTLLGGGLPPRAFAIVSGGTPPYELLWDTGETADTIFVDNGVYQLLATDANGCTGFAKEVVVATRERSALLAEASVFPNPTHGQLWVEARLHQAQPLHLRLLNMQGQVVWEELLGLSTEVRERIDLAALPQGGYWLQLVGRDGRLAVFLVQRI